MLTLVADENIPFVSEFFADVGEVIAVRGRDMTREQLLQADILIVRSVTHVNEALLKDTPVRFVGTCTIGVDHLDETYLNQANIAYASAPGCNAEGVLQYVLAAMAQLKPEWRHHKIGVVGCGNVGGRLIRVLQSLGVNAVGYDPYLSPQDFSYLGVWEEILDCSIICMHTPYTRQGLFPTHHLMNKSALMQLPSNTLLINAGRGAAIDNQALLEVLAIRSDLDVVLDVWEQEPHIALALVNRVTLGSPHIAGYSFEGKLKGSMMVHEALSAFLGRDVNLAKQHREALYQKYVGQSVPMMAHNLNQAILKSYPIGDDFRRFLPIAQKMPLQAAEFFDQLRKTYPERREFSHFQLKTEDETLKNNSMLLGFNAF